MKNHTTINIFDESHPWLTQLFFGSEIPVLVLEPEKGEIWEISKGTSLFFNLSPEKIKGENIVQFVEPNLQDDWKTKFERWRSGSSKTIQIQTCLKANENLFVPVLLNMQKVNWENSSLITVSIVDKTDEIKFREQLRLNEFCIDNAAISIFRIDEPDGKIVNANQLACSCLGYTKEELCSLTVFDIDPVFTRERWLNHRKRTAHLGSNVIKSTHKRKDGSTFPVEITITYLEYQGNKFSFSFARDISEHMDDEQKLKQQRKDYQYLFLNNPQPMWIYDLETLNFLEVNRAAVNSYGFSRQEFLKMSLRDIRPADDIPPC